MILLSTPSGDRGTDRIQAAGDGGGRRLDIALVTETYPPEINGVAMTLGRLVDGLGAAGHRVRVVRPRQEGDAGTGAGTVLRPGMALPGYPEVQLGLPSRLALAGTWRRRPPQIVHVATEGPLGLSALRAARSVGAAVTSSFHTNFDSYAGHYGIGAFSSTIGAYLRRFHNRTACTMVPTHEQARELSAAGFRRLRILSRGVDTVLFDPAKRDPELRRSWGVGDGDPVLITVGRLAPEKNLDCALRCLAAVRDLRPEARLLLVGDGPMRPRLEGIDGVILSGMRRGEDLARHYASADCFCFPSMTETFGNVLLEAMASGLPSVAYRYAAAAERLADPAVGRVVDYGDDAAFVAGCRDLAADDDRRRAIGAAARESVLPIGWKRVVGHFERYLRQAADDRKASRCR